ncbi:MAG: hypothetical protein NZ840_13825 [Anaerolineales bacterium]|nr:hypothetical protein [Anaerolineales bacterium]MDW8163112.1 hypothetical protein [Anaerolineales bacterium]
MPKRTSGEGSIYKRTTDGRWAASLMVAGKRHTLAAKTWAEAAEKVG